MNKVYIGYYCWGNDGCSTPNLAFLTEEAAIRWRSEGIGSRHYKELIINEV